MEQFKALKSIGDAAAARGVYHFAYTTANAGALTMTPDMQVVTLDSTDGAITVTLPPVQTVKGQIFAISAKTYVTAITIQDNDESYDWTNISLDADNDGALLFSDGMKFWVVTDNYS